MDSLSRAHAPDADALYLADISSGPDVSRVPLLLGLINYAQRHMTTGLFLPIRYAPDALRRDAFCPTIPGIPILNYT